MEQQYKTDSEIYAVLEREIIDLTLRPGCSLSENPLCTRFGAPRSLIRVVLQRLQENGLVKIVPYKGSELVHLPSNSTLRVWISRPKLDAAIEKDGYIELGYKARITLGSNGGAHASWTVPSLAKKYLSEEEVAEMQAILDRAKAAYIAATKKPVTALDKARAAYEKALAKLNALTAAEELADTTGADNTDAE